MAVLAWLLRRLGQTSVVLMDDDLATPAGKNITAMTL